MRNPDSEILADELHKLLFGVRRSARYHLRRRRFFERWHSVTNLVGLATGSAAIASVLSKHEWWALVSGVVVAVLSGFDLVVGTVAMAREHSDLARRFVLLERDIVLAGEPTPESLRQFTAKRLEIEADEPPVLRALDRICHNELCRALGLGPECFVSIPRHHRAFAQWFSFDPHNPGIENQ